MNRPYRYHIKDSYVHWKNGGKGLRLIKKPDEKTLAKAGEHIRAGEVVVYPTETLYGLGADATNADAIRKIFLMKGRLESSPIPVIVADMEMLRELVEEVNLISERLIKSFWPGPLTIIFDAKKSLPAELTAGTGSIGVRIPDSSVAVELVRAACRPLTATSANLSGKQPPSSMSEILSQLAKKPAMIIDVGELPSSAPSTVVDPRGKKVKILRQGAIGEKAIMEVLAGTGACE